MTKAEMKELVASDTARLIAAERAKLKPVVMPYVEQLRQHGLTKPEQGMDAIMARFEDSPEVDEALRMMGVHELVGEMLAEKIDAGELTHAGFAEDGTSIWRNIAAEGTKRS